MTHPTCKVIAIRGSLPTVAVGQSFESEYALGDQLGAMAAADTTLGGDVLVRMERDHSDRNETPSISCLRVRAGEVSWLRIHPSLDANELAYANADSASEFEIFVTGAPRIPAEFGTIDDGTLTLHNVVPSREVALAGLAELARQAANGDLEPDALEYALYIGDVCYEVSLDKLGFAFAPVHHWTDDADARAWIQGHLPAGERYPAAPTGSPLTTGSIAKRLKAAFAVAIEEKSNGVITYEPRRTREARDQLVAALADPANTGPEFSELRYKLHDLVLDQLTDPAETADYLIATTRSEVEAVRARLYEKLAKLTLPSAHRRLVEAFVTETPEISERVGALLWRQDEAVELLVREHLTNASSPALARRIVALLREEHINVPRGWLVNADPSVVTKLGSLVTDN